MWFLRRSCAPPARPGSCVAVLPGRGSELPRGRAVTEELAAETKNAENERVRQRFRFPSHGVLQGQRKVAPGSFGGHLAHEIEDPIVR